VVSGRRMISRATRNSPRVPLTSFVVPFDQFGKGFSLLSPSPSLSSLAHDPKSSSTTSSSNPDTDIFLQTVSNLSHYGSIGGSAPPWLGPRLNKFFRWSSARAQRIEDQKREQRQGRGRGGASSTSGSGSVGDKEKTAGPKGNEVIVHATRERVGARYDAVAAGEEVRKDVSFGPRRVYPQSHPYSTPLPALFTPGTDVGQVHERQTLDYG